MPLVKVQEVLGMRKVAGAALKSKKLRTAPARSGSRGSSDFILRLARAVRGGGNLRFTLTL